MKFYNWIITCAGCMQMFISAAQTTIKVQASENKMPLHLAHIFYSDVFGNNQQTVVTDSNGVAVIPSSFTSLHPVYKVKISYVGYVNITDTIKGNVTKTYSLVSLEVVLNECVVTAQYAPGSPEKAVHRIRVIDEKKIQSMAAVTLKDALTNEMNIRLSQDNVLGSGMSMQGVSGENVKILIDGVPVIGRLNGNVDISQINLNNIERIEIVEGPLSVNYGTNALAGTINLITKKSSARKVSGTLSSYNENIGTFNQLGDISFQKGKHHISLSGGRNYFDGWNSYDNFLPDFKRPVADTTRFKSWKPREQYFSRLGYNINLYKVQLGYKGEFFKETIINRGYPRNPYLETAFDDYYYTTRIDNAIHASGQIKKNFRFQSVTAYNYYQRIKNTYLKDLTTLNQELTQTPGDQDTTVFSLAMSRGSFSYVKDSVKINYEVGYDVNHENSKGLRLENGAGSMGDYAAFASAEYKPFTKLVIRPGIRYSYNTSYAAPLVPSLNLKFQSGDVTLRASYARGFRAPSLKELYFYFVDFNHNIRGNTDLKAEYSDNYSASALYKKQVKQTIWQTEVNLFYNNITNLITLANVQGTEFSYVNIGDFKSLGAGVNQSFMHEHLKINGGFLYTGRYNALSETNSETPAFSYTPEVRGNILYEWKKINFSASVFYKYQGSLPGYALNENNEVVFTYINPYHWMDVVLTKQFFKRHMALSAGVKNILNVQYVGSTSVSGGAHGGSSGSTPVAMGRNVFVKLDILLHRD